MSKVVDDEDKIREGIENVKNVLREHYVNPEESTLIQSKLSCYEPG